MILTLIPICTMMAYLFWNRHTGLGFFDASEYAVHIRGGGIAHAPGYPLYLILGKFFNQLCGDPFMAQQLISLSAFPIIIYCLNRTFTITESFQEPEKEFEIRRIQKEAFALTSLVFISSFYIKLFTVLPEVFLLNLALYAALIWRTTQWCFVPSPRNFLSLFLIYGLGACHHHTLALTLPGVALLVALVFLKRGHALNWKAHLISALCGTGIGLLPLLYLVLASRQVTEQAPYTFHLIQGLGDFFHVFLRLSYGTFSLTRGFESDLAALFTLIFQACLKNFNYIGILVFAPLLISGAFPGFFKPKSPNKSKFSQNKKPAAREAGTTQGFWTNRAKNSQHKSAKEKALQNPARTLAGITLVLFMGVFVPQANLPLGNSSYDLTFLRFMTIPFFLSLYFVYPSVQLWLESLAARSSLHKAIGFYSAFGLLLLSNLSGHGELRYRNFHRLDDHVRWSYQSIFEKTPTPPQSDALGNGYHKCAIFAVADTLLFSLQYFNQFIADKKCFVFFPFTFAEDFPSYYEDQLLVRLFGPDFLELGRHPENAPPPLHTLAQKLKDEGFQLFILYKPDYALFHNSTISYHLQGNILELASNKDSPSTFEDHVESYRTYLERLSAYLQGGHPEQLPENIVDSVARTAITQNLFEYAWFQEAYEKQGNPSHPELLLKQKMILRTL